MIGRKLEVYNLLNVKSCFGITPLSVSFAWYLSSTRSESAISIEGGTMLRDDYGEKTRFKGGYLVCCNGQ